MTAGDKKDYAAGMNLLAEVFRGEGGNVPKMRLAVYFEALNAEGVSLRQFEFAVKRLIQTRKSPFFPVPAEIVEVARQCPRLVLPAVDGVRLIAREPISLEQRRADKERLKAVRSNLEALDRQHGTKLAAKVCGAVEVTDG